MTYKVMLHFNEQAKENFEDKVLRMAKTDAEKNKLKKQGEISKNYTVPKEYITFRKPRVISEQQRERLIENLKKARGERRA